ncbi:hypothetical protein [Bacillus cytotoxicus]|uniref:hypothetical protein n=1 Tax=Bacillus cytotoxicus TaxID=580165 RepID=UPI0024472DB2|nr:hypothetical protein [Bacillus cytotoxicus]MDH2882511.1 hypothetical protein [Bacillus cytotoxicus]
MGQYFVVRSTEEYDVELGVVEARSLQEARNLVMEHSQETMEAGETFFIFFKKGEIQFDKNKRVIFPKEGKMIGISKIE